MYALHDVSLFWLAVKGQQNQHNCRRLSFIFTIPPNKQQLRKTLLLLTFHTIRTYVHGHSRSFNENKIRKPVHHNDDIWAVKVNWSDINCSGNFHDEYNCFSPALKNLRYSVDGTTWQRFIVYIKVPPRLLLQKSYNYTDPYKVLPTNEWASKETQKHFRLSTPSLYYWALARSVQVSNVVRVCVQYPGALVYILKLFSLVLEQHPPAHTFPITTELPNVINIYSPHVMRVRLISRSLIKLWLSDKHLKVARQQYE